MKINKPEYLPGEKLSDGTLYAGIMSDGKSSWHLSIEPQDEPNKMTWSAATKLPGCPTSRELSLISANAKALGLDECDDWYWSSTEGNPNLAYIQRFSDGVQSGNGKAYNFLVRCVRRYSIIRSFDHLLPEIAELKKRLAELEERIK